MSRSRRERERGKGRITWGRLWEESQPSTGFALVRILRQVAANPTSNSVPGAPPPQPLAQTRPVDTQMGSETQTQKGSESTTSLRRRADMLNGLHGTLSGTDPSMALGAEAPAALATADHPPDHHACPALGVQQTTALRQPAGGRRSSSLSELPKYQQKLRCPSCLSSPPCLQCHAPHGYPAFQPSCLPRTFEGKS